MSRSFTSRPAITNSRGRGRGTQTRTPQAINAGRVGTMNSGQGPGFGARPRRPTAMGQDAEEGMDTDESRTQQGQDVGQRMSYQGGYTVIPPNQRKREQINQVAQRETQAYQAHKQQNTPKQLSYVGTAGGRQVTQAEARRELIKTSPTKTAKLLQNQDRKNYFKQKEEEDIQKKKAEQRRKANENERRRVEREQADAHKWDEQRRRQNEAFLNRIEKQNRLHQTASGAQASSTTPSHQTTSMPTAVYDRNNYSSPSVAMATRHSTEPPERRADELESQRVTALSSIYPQYSREELYEILKTVDFSLDAAIDILAE